MYKTNTSLRIPARRHRLTGTSSRVRSGPKAGKTVPLPSAALVPRRPTLSLSPQRPWCCGAGVHATVRSQCLETCPLGLFQHPQPVSECSMQACEPRTCMQMCAQSGFHKPPALRAVTKGESHIISFSLPKTIQRPLGPQSLAVSIIRCPYSSPKGLSRPKGDIKVKMEQKTWPR